MESTTSYTKTYNPEKTLHKTKKGRTLITTVQPFRYTFINEVLHQLILCVPPTILQYPTILDTPICRHQLHEDAMPTNWQSYNLFHAKLV